MKSFKTIFVIGITCLQLMSGSQAQTTSTKVNATSAGVATSTSSSAVPTATLPPFVNTPGLSVNLYTGMTVVQNTMVSISASLNNQQNIGAIDISITKRDRTNNNTIATSTGSFVSTVQLWNVTSDAYPVGIYVINIIVTPTTIPAGSVQTTSGSQVATTTSAVQPVATGTPSNAYYWQGLIYVAAPRNTSLPTSSAMGMKFDHANSFSGFVALFVASGVAVLGSLLAL
ncbi:hypothetical protein BGZ49_008140 [Haplosporangium sp. Z 27]|nr:hypothetical protein BGZ49_008140 [Haplosporangium sp. Z 27]